MEFGENGRIKQRFRKMCADHHFFKPTSDDIAASLIAISLIVYRTGMSRINVATWLTSFSMYVFETFCLDSDLLVYSLNVHRLDTTTYF